MRPLANQVPLELGQGAEDVEGELPPRSGGIDLLSQALEANPRGNR